MVVRIFSPENLRDQLVFALILRMVLSRRDRILVEKENPILDSVLLGTGYGKCFHILSLTGQGVRRRFPVLPTFRPYGTRSKTNQRNTTPKASGRRPPFKHLNIVLWLFDDLRNALKPQGMEADIDFRYSLLEHDAIYGSGRLLTELVDPSDRLAKQV